MGVSSKDVNKWVTSPGNVGTATTSTVSRASMRGGYADTPIVTAQMLESEPFKVPIDSLVDIWVLRFGHRWVNLEEIENDEFFRAAYTRLKSVGQLEVHYLTDRAKYVCRKPE